MNRSTIVSVIVLLVILGIVLVLVSKERKASARAKAAYDKVLPLIPDETKPRSGAPTKQEDVHKLLGRAADGEPTRNGNMVKESYTWKGVFRQYTVDVEYRQNGQAMLLWNIELRTE